MTLNVLTEIKQDLAIIKTVSFLGRGIELGLHVLEARSMLTIIPAAPENKVATGKL